MLISERALPRCLKRRYLIKCTPHVSSSGEAQNQKIGKPNNSRVSWNSKPKGHRQRSPIPKGVKPLIDLFKQEN
jgi:hypothetical protein